MSTPPFNSPYQHAMRTTLLEAPAYPSPARSDSEPSKYQPDGLGLYDYSQPFPSSGPSTSSILYPPSPQPTESWNHLSTGTSPLMAAAPVDPWNSSYDHSHGPYDAPVPRSPLHWDPSHEDARVSYGYPPIKMESGAEWADNDASHPDYRHAPVTVSPERLNAGIFPYDNAYASPPMPRYELPPADGYEPMPWEQRPHSPEPRESSVGSTARTRLRRNPTTADNANFSCHLCGKLFQRSYNHKTHLETHNPKRKKDHICSIEGCEKQFVRKTDLDRHHNSVHRKLKEFKCVKCDASFARKDTLRRHVEDGCPKRHELRDPHVLSRNRSMRTSMPFYPSPRPEDDYGRSNDEYGSRSPPLFHDDF
ncbi:hypothetical protein B0J11DRAFT_553213 [Dendryphion nanum]|uniref:C2H2 type master regulator of conidiophore development brlA n=1 Tax=Dendryphion nanum TaxID=256645 RepID=A0A9P9DBU4_9PLEO|nr:hypothetical protein B0J11DRAFT_553213 [Dendryphion nanum]